MGIKKTLLLLAAAVVLPGNLAARQISRAEAAAVAAKYAVLSGQESGTLKYAQPSDARYYVFDTEGGGFVIVSGDSEMTELVAYSDESRFDSGNKNMMSWLGAYSDYVEKVRKGEAKPYKKALTEGTVVIAPLVTAKWGQMEPFNNLCPFDRVYQQNTMAGCVAISMAQIFHKWKWPASSVGTHTYVHDDYGELTFNGRVYFWPDMLDEYMSYYDSDGTLVHEYTDEEADEVAKLALDCGYVVDMVYGVDGSGANDYDIAYAIAEHFRFNTGLYYRDAMTDDDFREILYSELDELRPVSFGGDSMQGGHQFVVDGYDSNGFVHINWGWNGTADGYFDIDFMCPDIAGGDASMNFNYHQSFVTIDHTYDTPVVTTQRYLWMLADEIYSAYGRRVGYRLSANEVALDGSFDVECHSINNLNSVEYNGEIALAVFDTDDNLLFVDEDNAFKISALGANRYLDIDHEAPVITADGLLSGLENGSYTLRAVSREDGRDDWQRLVSDEKISVQVNDGTATLYTPTYAVSIDEIAISGTPEYDEFIDITVSITNKSDNADVGVLKWALLNPSGKIVKEGSEGMEFDENGKYVMTLNEYINEFIYEEDGEYTLWLREFTGSDGRRFDMEGETEVTFIVEDKSGVKAVTGKGIHITTDGHTVKITGTDATAEVFDISGRTITTTTEREFSISETGIYIVKAGSKITKIVIK